MIGDILVFLKNQLDAHLKARADEERGEPGGDKVVFVDGDKMDPIAFKLDAVSTLLINVEEERILRSADPHGRVGEDGVRQKVSPDIRLNLYILFVARFKQYERAWLHLSRIIQYFQNHRTFDPQSAPELADTVDHLVVELVTLDFAEQNEVWNALRTTHLPSLLYRVRLLVFADHDAPRPSTVGEKIMRIAP